MRGVWQCLFECIKEPIDYLFCFVGFLCCRTPSRSPFYWLRSVDMQLQNFFPCRERIRPQYSDAEKCRDLGEVLLTMRPKLVYTASSCMNQELSVCCLYVVCPFLSLPVCLFLSMPSWLMSVRCDGGAVRDDVWRSAKARVSVWRLITALS